MTSRAWCTVACLNEQCGDCPGGRCDCTCHAEHAARRDALYRILGIEPA